VLARAMAAGRDGRTLTSAWDPSSTRLSTGLHWRARSGQGLDWRWRICLYSSRCPPVMGEAKPGRGWRVADGAGCRYQAAGGMTGN